MDVDYIKLVKDDMKKRELKPAEYAVLMGVSVDAVYRWIRGKIRPSMSARLLMQFTDRQIVEAHAKLNKKEGRPWKVM